MGTTSIKSNLKFKDYGMTGGGQMSGVMFFARLWLIIAVVLLSQGGVEPAFSKELYVSPHGNDAQPGTAGQPWRTLQHAVTTAQPGDTVFLKAGNYPEDVNLNRSGRVETHSPLPRLRENRSLCGA